MLSLPPELKPWEPYLGFLDPTLVPDLGRLADEVLRLLSPIGTRQPHQGEPAGWSGLDRRGPMERLLSTDWALAEVAPDEFLRRTTQGELLFWQRERATSPLGGTSRLLLDCGPFQLGACRVVQLALLVVLARRAQEAGRTFVWCVGQEFRREYPGLTASSVASFLKARSTAPVSDDAVTHFQAGAGPEDELWLAGSPAFLRRQHGRHHALELEQTGPESVLLNQRHTLKLPPLRCVRLLRDPFGHHHHPTLGSLSVGGDFDFSQCGRKLLVRGPGQVVVYPIPNSPRDGLGIPRVYPTDPAHVVLAVGWSHDGLTVLEAGQGAWSLRAAHRPGSPRVVEIAFPAENKPLGELGRVWKEPANRAAMRPDLLRRALRLEDGRIQLSPLPLGVAPTADPTPEALEHLCQVAPRMGLILDGAVWMSHPAHGLVRLNSIEASLGSLVVIGTRIHRLSNGGLNPLFDLDTWALDESEKSPFSQIWLGYGGAQALPQVGCVAAVQDSIPGHWWVFGPQGFRGWKVSHVVGVVADPDHWKTPALISLEGATVRFSGRGWEKTVDFPGELEKVVCCPAAPRLAYRTRDGELGVYSIPHQRFLLRVTP